jgi:hypothetical protein
MREFHRNSPRVFSRRVAPTRRGGPGASPSRSDSTRVPREGPALLTPRFLGHAPRIALWVAASCPEPAKGSPDISGSFVGRGFSRDIKNRLSQTFLSAAFSPSLRFGRAGSPYVPSPGSKYGGAGRKSLPTSGSGTISNRNKPKYRSSRKQTIKPCLTGARIACQAIAARSAT